MFDAFEFVQNRAEGKRVSPIEASEFDAYKTIEVLSMDPNLIDWALRLNTIAVTKIPREMQAKVFNAFNCMKINVNWCRARIAEISARNALINKIMTVYSMSCNTATYLLDNNLVDEKYVEEQYDYAINHVVPKAKKTGSAMRKLKKK